MKFQYVGDGAEPPEKTVAYGHSFTLNHKGVEVTDEFTIRKLSGNASFRVMEDEVKGKKGKKADKEEV